MAPSKTNWLSLVGFLLLCFAVSAFGGLFQPGDWYQGLNKAPWTPPNIAFPIVWSFLYVMIAITGWQLYRSNNTILFSLWCAQLVLNALWSWIFFGEQWTVIGLVDLVLLDILVINLALKSWRAGLRPTAYLLVPYVTWLLIATSLNTYIVFAN